MADIKKLLAIKKMKKVQKPAFLRRNFKKNKRARVTGEWRAPKGLHNKLRRRRRGIGQWVMPGYRMPVAVRGMTREGLLPIVVENIEPLFLLIGDRVGISCQPAVQRGIIGHKGGFIQLDRQTKEEGKVGLHLRKTCGCEFR